VGTSEDQSEDKSMLKFHCSWCSMSSFWYRAVLEPRGQNSSIVKSLVAHRHKPYMAPISPGLGWQAAHCYMVENWLESKAENSDGCKQWR